MIFKTCPFSRFKPFLPLLLIIALSASAWMMGLSHYLSLDTLKTHQQAFELFISNHQTSSVFIFIALYIAVVGLSIPGAAFMSLAGGFLFGRIVGTVAVIGGATAGATLLFFTTRLASRDLIVNKAGPWMEKMKAGFQENAFSYLLTLRLIPLFPFVAVNLVAALFQIPLRTFILATFLGIIPGSFVFVSIGTALKDIIQTPEFSPHIILNPSILLAFTGLGILSLLPVLYKHFQKRVAHVVRAANPDCLENLTMPDKPAPKSSASRGFHKPSKLD